MNIAIGWDMNRLVSTAILLCLFVSLGAAAAEVQSISNSSDEPTIPHVERDVCPFECCQFGLWVVRDSTTAFESEFDTSRVAFTISPGDTVLAETGHLIYERFGKVLIREPIRSFQPGDTVLALRCAGESGFLIWEHGELVAVEQFWPLTEQGEIEVGSKYAGEGDPHNPAIMIEHPRMLWWVRVRDSLGNAGWLKLENEITYCLRFDVRIDGADACS